MMRKALFLLSLAFLFHIEGRRKGTGFIYEEKVQATSIVPTFN